MKKTFVESHLNKISVPKAKVARKPKADSKLDNTILKTPIRKAPKNVESMGVASNFMRTTAFTMQNKIRSAISQIKRVDAPVKMPLASFNSPSSNLQPNSSSAWLSKPINLFKLGFVLSVVCCVGAYATFSEEISSGLGSSTKVVSSWFEDKELAPDLLLLPKTSEVAPVEMVSDKVVNSEATNSLPIEAPAAAIVKPAKKPSLERVVPTEKSKSASIKQSKKNKVAKKNIKKAKPGHTKNKSKGVVSK